MVSEKPKKSVLELLQETNDILADMDFSPGAINYAWPKVWRHKVSSYLRNLWSAIKGEDPWD